MNTRTVARTAGPQAWNWMLATLLFLGGCLGWVAAARAADDAPGRVGRAADIQGGAWLYDTEVNEWTALQRNRPLTTGDRVTVDEGGRVELRIGSTTVRLDGGSDLEFSRLDDDRIDLYLHRGSAALRVRAPEVANELMLETAEGRFLPRRSGHYRIDHRDDTSFATAWSGELRFESPDSSLAIPPGRRAELWLDSGDQRTHYTWSASERDAFSDWVARDNRDDERNAASRYVSPEMTGWEDLDRHGRWDQHPDYGAVWFPTVVVADWAPYRYGHWAWVRPWGWTWVDDAPWGFAPSHYGRWVNWRGRWCWAPGTRVVRPVYAPALVAWVGGPQASISVTIGGRPAPAVGWVPLAPYEVYRPSYRVRPTQLRYLNPWEHDARRPTTVPTGPVAYTNRGVPGAVSVVPADAMTRRAPVVPQRPSSNEAWMRDFRDSPWNHQAPPPPAPTRVVPVPGGAVPVPAPQRLPVQPRPQAPMVTPAVPVPGGGVPGVVTPVRPAAAPERRDTRRDGPPERSQERAIERQNERQGERQNDTRREPRGEQRSDTLRPPVPSVRPAAVNPVPAPAVPPAPAAPSLRPAVPAAGPAHIPQERRGETRDDNRRDNRRAEPRPQDEPVPRQEPAERQRSPGRNSVN